MNNSLCDVDNFPIFGILLLNKQYKFLEVCNRSGSYRPFFICIISAEALILSRAD